MCVRVQVCVCVQSCVYVSERVYPDIITGVNVVVHKLVVHSVVHRLALCTLWLL